MEGGNTFIVCFSFCLFLDKFWSFVIGTLCNNGAVYVFGRGGWMFHPLSKMIVGSYDCCYEKH